MSELIQISTGDCKRVAELLGDWHGDRVAAVMAVLTAYNEWVSGDPIGTVRCHPNGSEVAVSCGPRKWWLFNETSPLETPRLISKDPVIPSWPVAVVAS